MVCRERLTLPRLPRLRTAKPSPPPPGGADDTGVHTPTAEDLYPPPPRRAAPGVLGGALSAKAAAGKIRRKSKDLEASLDLMAASDAWNALGACRARRNEPPMHPILHCPLKAQRPACLPAYAQLRGYAT